LQPEQNTGEQFFWIVKIHNRNSFGFDISILRRSGISGAADGAVLKKVILKIQNSPFKIPSTVQRVHGSGAKAP
jgi:hypothetical protein